MQTQLEILVVANDAQGRYAVRQALSQSSHHYARAFIREAASYAEAEELLSAHHFSCIILDDTLPGSHAQRGFLSLRTAGVTLPIILLLSQSDPDPAAETYQAGATVCLLTGDLSPLQMEHRLEGVLRLHQFQEQARQGQEELRLRDRAIAAAINGIIICDARQPDCPIVYCNPAFTAMTGYGSEEMLGRNCRFLQGEDTDRRDVRRVRRSVEQGTACQIVLRNYKKDGTPFWNELTLSPVHDASGTLTQFIGVQNDITEHRNAEEALQQNISRQQAVLREMFASVTAGKLILCSAKEDLPSPLPSFAEPIALSGTSGIRELRQSAVNACRVASFPEIRVGDMETAVGEAAMNAVVHSGVGMGQVFLSESGTVQVRVEDKGTGITEADLPQATLKRGYSTAGTLGHGFKMILTTADRVYLLTNGTGTVVVIEQDRAAVPAGW